MRESEAPVASMSIPRSVAQNASAHPNERMVGGGDGGIGVLAVEHLDGHVDVER